MHQGTFRRYAIDIFGKWFCLLAYLPSDVAKARGVKLKRLGCLEVDDQLNYQVLFAPKITLAVLVHSDRRARRDLPAFHPAASSSRAGRMTRAAGSGARHSRSTIFCFRSVVNNRVPDFTYLHCQRVFLVARYRLFGLTPTAIQQGNRSLNARSRWRFWLTHNCSQSL